MRTWLFAKGHGTGNDFVLIKDRSGLTDPTREDVRFLCDRRRGIGGDGLLRAVRAERMSEWTGPGDIWFMDYRNADGSVAAMCGNGLRVFVRWLVDEGLAGGDVIEVATRAGLRRVVVHPDGRLSIHMGTPSWDPIPYTVRTRDAEWSGHPVVADNPHCVVRVADPDSLAAIDLFHPVGLDDTRFPDGANVEFVTRLRPGHIRLRVFERGVGETLSCGTGTVAAACDARQEWGGDDWRVEVPGGVLKVAFTEDGVATLTGPAVIVARGEVSLPDA